MHYNTMFLLAVSLSLAAIRIGGSTNVFFKDAAHIWMGFLIGALTFRKLDRKYVWWFFGALIVIESACAIIARL